MPVSFCYYYHFIIIIIILLLLLIIIIIIIIIIWRVGIGWVNIVCSEIPFGVDSNRMETSQFFCIPNQLPDFCIVRVSAEGNYGMDFN